MLREAYLNGQVVRLQARVRLIPLIYATTEHEAGHENHLSHFSLQPCQILAKFKRMLQERPESNESSTDFRQGSETLF